MVAGLFGPRACSHSPSASREPAPETASNDDDAIQSDAEDDAEDQPTVGPDMSPDSAYHSIFGDVPLEDAVLVMFCQAALVNNLLYRDNMADAYTMTDADASEVASAARLLGHMIQELLGPVATTKLHRLMFHLLQELRNRGNLAEGDTSINEHMHASGKGMFRRSNKRGPLLQLQMIRVDETQAQILARMDGEARMAKRAADLAAGKLSIEDVLSGALSAVNVTGEDADEGEDDDGGADGPGSASQAKPSPALRGARITLSSVAARPGLAKLAAVLGVAEDDATISVANTASIRARFEWGGRGAVQPVRGADSFHGSPWHSHVCYMTANGETRWGLVRVVVRAVNGRQRHCVVIQCLQRAAPRDGCVLTRFGCQRLSWDFAAPGDEWPRLAAVDLGDILRLEQVHVDWWDLARRVGIFAMPSTMPQTADERHKTRFFTNVFYPWTSRSLRLGV